MPDDRALAIRQLRSLLKAYDRYSRAVGGPAGSEGELDAEFEQLIVLLENRWARSLDEFIQSSRKALVEAHVAMSGDLVSRPQVLATEAALLSELRIDAERLEWLHDLYLEDARMSDGFPATSAEFIGRLRALHKRAKSRISESRTLGRKAKKRRKRAVAQGFMSLAVSIGAFVSNVHLPPIMAWSYALGGSALHQAMRDITGQKED